MRSFSAIGIVLKRTDVGETDRVVTLFTREFGKIVAVAKGCRKLNSSKLASLEPGTLSKVFFVKTKSLPILTQAQLINDYPNAKKDLSRLRKVFEVLEMLDSLLIEEIEQTEIFSHVLAIFNHLDLESSHAGVIRSHLSSIIEILGFGQEQKIDLTRPLRDFVEEITSSKMRAFAFLTV